MARVILMLLRIKVKQNQALFCTTTTTQKQAVLVFAKDEYLVRGTILILRDCHLPISTSYLSNIYCDQKLLALDVPLFIINNLFCSKLIKRNLMMFDVHEPVHRDLLFLVNQFAAVLVESEQSSESSMTPASSKLSEYYQLL
jgi:hypothetical protein